MYTSVLTTGLSMNHMCAMLTESQKKTLNLLKLEPMVVDSQFVDAENQTRGKAVSDLKCQANIPDPVFNF